MTTPLLLAFGAYVLGSLSTAILLCRALGLPDPRTEGSRNPGATNVLRIAGKKAAALVLASDLLKGLVPVLAARALAMDDAVVAAVGLGAFLGHLYPLFFGFQGGKGVATALGVLLGAVWPVALAAMATWLIVVAAFRISSLAAISAALLAPLHAWLLSDSTPLQVMVGVMSVMLLWRHRGNIQRLLNGEEGRLGRKPHAHHESGRNSDKS
jgi:glycerol-3-phosphate acyltransferase PlsY